MDTSLPSQCQALVLDSHESGFNIQSIATPTPGPGSVVIRVIAVSTLSYQRDIYNGVHKYPFPMPLIGGMSSIARVAATGPDAVKLKVGQLVFFDCVIHGRDDPDEFFLSAIHEGATDASRKLASQIWTNATYAEFAKVPLENCHPLPELRLCRDLGYSTEDLAYIACMMVPYGGLRNIGLQPGETVVICPSTGNFGGAAVQVAVAMGAKVIATGRNETTLTQLKDHVLKGTSDAAIETVQITGDEHKDAETIQEFGPVDAILDLTPFAASKSTHFRSAVRALKRNGRASLMAAAELPNDPEMRWRIVGNNLLFKGMLMYERSDIALFIKLLEKGAFPRGGDLVNTKSGAMGDWRKAFDKATEWTGIGKQVVMTPDF